jgi:hypothetical protein
MDLNEALLAQKTKCEGDEARSAAWVGHHRKKRQRPETDLPARKSDARPAETLALDSADESPPPEIRDFSAEVEATAASARRAQVISNLVQYVVLTELGGKQNMASGDEMGTIPDPLELLVEQAAARPAAFMENIHVASLRGDAPSTVSSSPVALAEAKYRGLLQLMNWKTDAGCGWTQGGSREQKKQRMESALAAVRRAASHAACSGQATQPPALLSLYAADPSKPTSAREAVSALLQCSDDEDD